MEFDFSFMLEALKAALKFTPTTLLLAIVPLILGVVLGTGIAIIRLFKVKYLSEFFTIYVVIIRGIPLALLLLMTYFAFVQGFDAIKNLFHLKIMSKDISLVYIALFTFTLYSTATISESIRGALASIDKGQYEGAYSIGLTKRQTLKRIILPQIVPITIPMLSNSFIGLVKGSSLAFMISVTDLLNGALITATGNYKFLEAYIAAALVYWVICIIIERIAYFYEGRLGLFNRRELV